MRTIGMIGGISWHSTLEYYRLINTGVADRVGGHASARIALQSLDFAQVRRLQESEDWTGAGRLLGGAAQRCQAAGADFVIICANLMHRVAADVQAAVEVPLLHVADAVVARAREQGLTRLGLLGTRWVMEEDFYRDRLRAGGLEVVVPDAGARADLDRIIFAELTRGLIQPASMERALRIIDALQGQGAQAVLLACTELDLLISAQTCAVPLLDSTQIHAEAAVRAALS